MTRPAIRVEHLSKQYHIGGPQARYKTLRESAMEFIKSPLKKLLSNNDQTIWALRDVYFEVQPGEVVGVIGRNGAGKSTLLKLLSHITSPTEGRIEIYGRVGSLLEVGTGFHPELTGRDNIYLNGAILGMKRWEIDKKFEEIVDFAEIEKFLDTPVKHYSSGMYMRLAFAVAAHLEPEILLVDEVLAVGDTEFQKKCLGKMGEVARGGRTVLYVSHNMASIKQLCENGILLVKGSMGFSGRIDAVINHYLAPRIGTSPIKDLSGFQNSYGNHEIDVLSIELLNPTKDDFSINFDQHLELKIKIDVNEDISNVSFAFGVLTVENYPLFTVRSSDNDKGSFSLCKGKQYEIVTFLKHNLRAGLYNLILGIASGNYNYYYNPSVAQFEILETGDREYLYKNDGIINCEGVWDIIG